MISTTSSWKRDAMIPARWGISLTALFDDDVAVLGKRNQSAVANPKEFFVFEDQNVCSGKDGENIVIWANWQN